MSGGGVIYFWYVLYIVKEIVPQLLVGRQGRWTVVDIGGGKVALHNAKYNRRLVSDEPLVEAPGFKTRKNRKATKRMRCPYVPIFCHP